MVSTHNLLTIVCESQDTNGTLISFHNFGFPTSAKMKVLDYGDCIVDSSYHGGYGTKYEMKICENGEDKPAVDTFKGEKFPFRPP